jgi:excisionase family DNA binding protein
LQVQKPGAAMVSSLVDMSNLRYHGRTRNPDQGDTKMKVLGQEYSELLTPAEVAGIFRVDPKTVTRWANAGRLKSIRTLGGHRRFEKAEVERLLNGARS